MSPIVAVQYKPRCVGCGVLVMDPWMLVWRPDGRWDALCKDCSFALMMMAMEPRADAQNQRRGP